MSNSPVLGWTVRSLTRLERDWVIRSAQEGITDASFGHGYNSCSIVAVILPLKGAKTLNILCGSSRMAKRVNACKILSMKAYKGTLGCPPIRGMLKK
jgi:hypothetical protein